MQKLLPCTRYLWRRLRHCPVAVAEPLPQPVRGSTANCATLSQLVVVGFAFAFCFLSLCYNWLRVLSK